MVSRTDRKAPRYAECWTQHKFNWKSVQVIFLEHLVIKNIFHCQVLMVLITGPTVKCAVRAEQQK